MTVTIKGDGYFIYVTDFQITLNYKAINFTSEQAVKAQLGRTGIALFFL
jgi:hypothetical protein